jgi:hypothetical protein
VIAEAHRKGVHRVRRQTWRLCVASPPAAFAARARFRAEVEDLLPAFGRAFDAWAPGDTVLRIPRLELSLRVRSLDELAAKLAEALRREAPAPAAPAPRAAAADALRDLLHYLATGRLEWHAAHAEPAVAAAALRETLREALPAAVRAAPSGATAFEAAAHFWIRLLELLPLERWPEAATLVQRREARKPAAAGAPDTSASAAAGPAPAAPELLAAIGAIVHARASIGGRAALALAAAVLASAPLRALAAGRVREMLARLAGAAAPLETPEPVARHFASRAPAPVLSPNPEAPRARARPQAPRPTGARAGAPEARPFALMADNAGLVILHPFLPRLFESCELHAPGGRFAPHALARAAALLHWLAHGRDEVHEFELPVVKVLLGLRPDDPLAAGAGLVGARERDEGGALLRAAIAHWKALGATSIDGLRIAFLQRRAALRDEEDGWHLQPERESFDVLLERLPWSFSTVKLPWMTRPLYTDWPTR